jgi:hypothetical protein
MMLHPTQELEPPANPARFNRLRRAVSDLTLDKLILSEAARGNY